MQLAKVTSSMEAVMLALLAAGLLANAVAASPASCDAASGAPSGVAFGSLLQDSTQLRLGAAEESERSTRSKAAAAAAATPAVEAARGPPTALFAGAVARHEPEGEAEAEAAVEEAAAGGEEPAAEAAELKEAGGEEGAKSKRPVIERKFIVVVPKFTHTREAKGVATEEGMRSRELPWVWPLPTDSPPAGASLPMSASLPKEAPVQPAAPTEAPPSISLFSFLMYFLCGVFLTYLIWKSCAAHEAPWSMDKMGDLLKWNPYEDEDKKKAPTAQGASYVSSNLGSGVARQYSTNPTDVEATFGMIVRGGHANPPGAQGPTLRVPPVSSMLRPVEPAIAAAPSTAPLPAQLVASPPATGFLPTRVASPPGTGPLVLLATPSISMLPRTASPRSSVVGVALPRPGTLQAVPLPPPGTVQVLGISPSPSGQLRPRSMSPERVERRAVLEPVTFLPATWGPMGQDRRPGSPVTLEPVAATSPRPSIVRKEQSPVGRASVVLEPPAAATTPRSSPRSSPPPSVCWVPAGASTLEPITSSVTRQLSPVQEPITSLVSTSPRLVATGVAAGTGGPTTQLTIPTLRGLLTASGWATPEPPLLAIYNAEQRVIYRVTVALPDEQATSEGGRAPPLISIRSVMVDSGVDGPLVAICRTGGESEGHKTVYISDPQELLLAVLAATDRAPGEPASFVLKSSGNAPAKEEFVLTGLFNDRVHICTRHNVRVGGTEPGTGQGGGARPNLLHLGPQAEPLRLLIVASLIAIEIEEARSSP